MAFASKWLALREPADRAARDETLLNKAITAAGPTPVVLDLGCGTGSTVRTLSPLLPESTTWRLVDNDQELLDIAASNLPWSTVHLLDIRDTRSLPLDGVTLVTCSALLDLVTESWLHDLAGVVTVPFYAALSYNGVMRWEPELPQDRAVTEAFNQHQRQDKGLGPALGPDAATRAVEVFHSAGWTTEVARSDWALGPDSEALHAALVEGIGQAASEAGEDRAKDWTKQRVSASSHSGCVIGHIDILATPPTKDSDATR